MTRIAIIGGGVAAHTTLKSYLAAAGGDRDPSTDTVDIFTTEPHAPYRRPEVNKGMLLTGKTPAEVALPGGILTEPGVTLHLSTVVTAVDPAAHTLTAGDTTYAWDRLVFATGAGPRLLDPTTNPWLADRDVHYIRTPEHSAALRTRLAGLAPTDTVVVVGGGVLGLEAASAAATLSDAQVHVLEMGDEVCARMLPPTASRWLRDRHAEHGVTVTCGLDAAALAAQIDRLDPTVVVVSVGAVRDTMLAEDAGIAVGERPGAGIIVDPAGRTSAPDVWAAGDCVEVHGEVDGVPVIVRPEDEGSARTLGTLVGRQLAATGTAAATAERGSYLTEQRRGWTNQYGLMLNIVGDAGTASDDRREQVELSSPEELVVFTVASGAPGAGDVVTGVTTVGRSPEVRAAKNALGTVLTA
ncbi:FAD-dependent oxidoreductase [Corynebacterium nuruki]|nr:NAD(P)/FAD-dependent oxidoreductase [Corynebacterium nuruki]